MISWLKAAALGVLWELFGGLRPKASAEKQYPEAPSTLEDVDARLPADDELIDEILIRALELYGQTDARRARIETKASTVLAATAVSSALTVAAGSLFLNRPGDLSRTDVLPFGLLIVATVLAMLYSAYKALRTVLASQWAAPGSLELYKSHGGRAHLRRRWTSQVLVADAFNRKAINTKGDWLREAQAWYVFGLLLLACSAAALVVTSVIANPDSAVVTSMSPVSD